MIGSPEELAVRLRLAREQAGLSQGQVAKLLGVHRPTISEIEAGRRRVQAQELARFADLYRVSLAWLLTQGNNGDDAHEAKIRLAARLVALAGLEGQLAAIQQAHGTGRRGRRARRSTEALVQITGEALDVLSDATRARYVDDRGPGPAWAMARLEVREDGTIVGALIEGE